MPWRGCGLRRTATPRCAGIKSMMDGMGVFAYSTAGGVRTDWKISHCSYAQCKKCNASWGWLKVEKYNQTRFSDTDQGLSWAKSVINLTIKTLVDKTKVYLSKSWPNNMMDVPCLVIIIETNSSVFICMFRVVGRERYLQECTGWCSHQHKQSPGAAEEPDIWWLCCRSVEGLGQKCVHAVTGVVLKE